MELLVLAAALPSAAPDLPVKFDLGISRPCKPDPAGGEIVVCARPDANRRYRYRDLAVDGPPLLPRAEMQLNDRMSLAASTENADVGGFRSNRAMVRFTLKF